MRFHIKSRAPHPVKRNCSLGNILPNEPLSTAHLLASARDREMRRWAIMDRNVQAIFWYFYRPIFKSESRRRSAGFKETSNHTSFLGYSRIVFPFLSVIRIPDGSISIRLAFGSLKIVLLDSSPTRKV